MDKTIYIDTPNTFTKESIYLFERENGATKLFCDNKFDKTYCNEISFYHRNYF